MPTPADIRDFFRKYATTDFAIGGRNPVVFLLSDRQPPQSQSIETR